MIRAIRSVRLRILPPAAAAVISALAAAFVATATASANTLVLSSPAEAGFDAEKLEAAAGLYREAVQRDELRGVVLLVAKDGKVALHEAIGWRDKENGLRMETDTLFRMASNTKAVVTTAALILVEDGKLSPGDPVGRHIPAFDQGDFAQITVAHLMSNGSGLPRGPIFLSGVEEDSNLTREAERFAAALELENPPGTQYGYSNAGFNILGGVIETVGGLRLDHFIRERIYEPLGMRESTHHETVADPARMAKVYHRRDGEWHTRWAPGDDPSFPIIRASGGMITTARDYAIFLQSWLNDGAYGPVRILREESARLGRTVQSPTGSYGFGWRIETDGAFLHGGSDGTFAWVDPGRGIIGMVLTQSPGGDNPRDEFRQLVNEAMAEPAATEKGTR